MAPEQAAGRAVDEHADLYALGLVLYEALAGENPVSGGLADRDRAPDRHRAAAAGHAAARDLPRELCAALDRAIAPNPEQRGELDDLFDALADALGDVSDEGGLIAPHPLERAAPGAAARDRAAGRAGGGGRARVGGARGADARARRPAGARGARLAVALVAVLPRVGWLAAAVGVPLLLALGPIQRPGAALLVAALAFAPPLLLRADGRAWALPAAAPAARPRSASPAPTPRWRAARRAGARASRSARSAPGGSCSPSRCSSARSSSARRRTCRPAPSFDGAPGITAGDVIAPPSAPARCCWRAIWAGAALVLPWLVRGRSLAADVVAASAWSAGTAAATIALGEALGDARRARRAPHGLVPGAVAAAALALALAHLRRRPRRSPPDRRANLNEDRPAFGAEPPYLCRMRSGSPR